MRVSCRLEAPDCRTARPCQVQDDAAAAPRLLAAMRNLVIGMLRLCGVKNIAAALRHYGWKPWETLALIGLPANN